MKILHTADWHIGECRKFPDYLARHDLILKKIYEAAQFHKVETIIVAGDLFHRKDTTNEEFDLLLRWLLKFEESFHMVIISGNHDHLYGTFTQLQPFLSLYNSGRFKNTKVTDTPCTHMHKDVGFILIPWGSYSTEDFNAKVAELHILIQDKGMKHYCIVAHELINGSVIDNGKSFQGLNISMPSWCNYIALGDIHKTQSFFPNTHYSGAPAQFKFDDLLPKGILLVDSSTWIPEFVPLNGIKPLVVLTEVPTEWPDAYIKLNVRDQDLPDVLSDNVIKIETVIENEGISEISVSDIDLLQGLPEFLASHGLAKEEQNEAIEIVKGIVNQF